MWDVLHRQMRRQREVERVLPRVERAAHRGAAPLSPSQLRLWRLEQSRGSVDLAYNVTVPLRLAGPLDRAALRHAVLELAARHEALRTVFSERDGVPLQRSEEGLEPEVALAGSKGRAAADEADVERWLAAEAARRFDLGAGPPFRVGLYRRAPDEHILFLMAHHLVADGRSISVLLTELSAFYRARLARADAALPPPPLHLVDVVLWQRAWLESDAADGFVGFWREQLARRPAPLAPLAHAGYLGGRVYFEIPAATAARAYELAAEAGVSAPAAFLAAFQLLLHVHTERDVLSVGIPAANRGRPELADVVGLLANVLPLVSELDSELSFRDWMVRSDAGVSDAYAYQAMPIEHLATTPAESGGPSTALPVDSFFAHYRGVVERPLPLPGLDVTIQPLQVKQAEFPVMLTIVDWRGEIVGKLAFAAAAYDEGEARRLADGYLALLSRVAADPDAPLRRLAQET